MRFCKLMLIGKKKLYMITTEKFQRNIRFKLTLVKRYKGTKNFEKSLSLSL